MYTEFVPEIYLADVQEWYSTWFPRVNCLNILQIIQHVGAAGVLESGEVEAAPLAGRLLELETLGDRLESFGRGGIGGLDFWAVSPSRLFQHQSSPRSWFHRYALSGPLLQRQEGEGRLTGCRAHTHGHEELKLWLSLYRFNKETLVSDRTLA